MASDSIGHNCTKFLQAKRIVNSDSLSKTIHLTKNHMEPNESVILPDFKTLARPDEEAFQTILNVVRFNRGRVIFNRGSKIPETESDLPPAPPAFDLRGFDEVDSPNKTRDMIDSAHNLTF